MATLRACRDDPISNLDFSEWDDAFPGNRIVGAATLDRLRHRAYRIILDGDSFRTPIPMPEIDQNRLAKSSKQAHSRASSKSHFMRILTGLITPIIPGSIAPIRDSVPLRLVNVLGHPMIADGIRLRVRIETWSTEIDSLASRY
jgi:hypothetical protein